MQDLFWPVFVLTLYFPKQVQALNLPLQNAECHAAALYDSILSASNKVRLFFDSANMFIAGCNIFYLACFIINGSLCDSNEEESAQAFCQISVFLIYLFLYTTVWRRSRYNWMRDPSEYVLHLAVWYSMRGGHTVGKQEAKYDKFSGLLTLVLLLFFSNVIYEAAKNMLSPGPFPTQLIRDFLPTKKSRCLPFLCAATLPLWMPVMHSQGFFFFFFF